MAQDISINLGQGNGGVTERAIQLIALLTVLSIAPSILIMMTSFTRIVVVLSLLRTALGTATAPPNSVIIALAMFLTAFVMGPVLQKSYDDGIKPLVANQIGVEEALQKASVPLRGFMQKNVREKDLKLFMDLSGEPPPATPEDMSLRILVPAFMISELKRAFEIGFLLVPALPDHRPRGRLGTDVDGHDDAAAGRGVAAVQTDLLRSGRRLVAGGGQPGAELRRRRIEVGMLASQRDLFDVPRDVCYLNSASYSPFRCELWKPAAPRSAARADPGRSTLILRDASTSAPAPPPPA